MNKQQKLNLNEVVINSAEINNVTLRDLCIDLDDCKNVYIIINGCKYECDKNRIVSLLKSSKLVEVL